MLTQLLPFFNSACVCYTNSNFLNVVKLSRYFPKCVLGVLLVSQLYVITGDLETLDLARIMRPDMQPTPHTSASHSERQFGKYSGILISDCLIIPLLLP